MEYLTLEIGDYELDVIPLHEMPGLKVLRMLTLQPDMKRLRASVEMIRLALRDPRDWDNKVQFFTMGQLMKLVDDWMNESQEMANRQAQEMSGGFLDDEDEIDDFDEKDIDPNQLFELFMKHLDQNEDEDEDSEGEED